MKHRSQFPPGPRGQRGYDTGEVDDFFAAVERGEVSAQDVHDIAFGRASLGSRGYDWVAVDEKLNEIERRLRREST